MTEESDAPSNESRQRVAGSPRLLPWPLARRFVFFLLIPLASWLGGALVERLVGLALDRGRRQDVSAACSSEAPQALQKRAFVSWPSAMHCGQQRVVTFRLAAAVSTISAVTMPVGTAMML